MDDSVLDSNYPGFHDYQSTALVNLKQYFRDLFQKSAQYTSRDGYRHLEVQTKYGETWEYLDLKITRNITDQKITESVQYTLSNGNSFNINYVREGSELNPSTDDDLLLLNIFPTDNLTHFSLTISQLQSIFDLVKTSQLEKTSFSLGLIDSNISINTTTSDKYVSRDYLMIFSAEDEPQTQMSVKAFYVTPMSSEISYIHYIPQYGGEVTPNYFFNGLNGISYLLKSLSSQYEMKLYEIGFPKF